VPTVIAPHFNIPSSCWKSIVQLQLTVIPITWRSRRTGQAKLQIKEMGSRYLFIIFYVWLEKYFSAGDYRKRVGQG
jgi:dolichol-phosphate mannosyltransferase